MRLTLVAVGRLKERFWREAAEEYLKRLRPYADVRVVEIADRDSGRVGEARALAEEGADVLKGLSGGEHVIALEIQVASCPVRPCPKGSLRWGSRDAATSSSSSAGRTGSHARWLTAPTRRSRWVR